MPLLKKSQYVLHPNPDLPDPKAIVYQLWPTGEIFETYEDYLKGHAHLQRPQWTCRLTGRTGLSYPQALSMEGEAAECVEAIPDSVKRFAAAKAHYSLTAISVVVDQIVVELRGRYLSDEPLLFEIEPGRKVPARLRSDPIDNTHLLDLLDYRGQVIGEARAVGGELVSRPKNALSKNLIKKFLRGVAHRRNAFLPWQIDQKILDDLGVTVEPSAEVAAILLKDAASKTKSPKKVKSIALESPMSLYPMEDHLLFSEDMVDEELFPKLESCPKYFCGALEVWIFITTFSKALGISPMTWEDWLEALQWNEKKNPPLETVFSVFLQPIAKAKRTINKSAYFEWLSPIIWFLPDQPTCSSLLESFLESKFKWTEDSSWAGMLAGFLADCITIDPVNGFLSPLVDSLVDKKDPLASIVELNVQTRVDLLLALLRLHLLRFDAAKNFVENLISHQDESIYKRRDLLVELKRLEEQIASQEIKVSEMKERGEIKAARKGEAMLRGLRATDTKLRRKLEKVERELAKVDALRLEPLGTDHCGRKYWSLMQSVYVEINNVWHKMDQDSFRTITEKYLNEKGIRERTLKAELLKLDVFSGEREESENNNEDSGPPAKKLARGGNKPNFLKYKNLLQ